MVQASHLSTVPPFSESIRSVMTVPACPSANAYGAVPGAWCKHQRIPRPGWQRWLPWFRVVGSSGGTGWAPGFPALAAASPPPRYAGNSSFRTRRFQPRQRSIVWHEVFENGLSIGGRYVSRSFANPGIQGRARLHAHVDLVIGRPRSPSSWASDHCRKVRPKGPRPPRCALGPNRHDHRPNVGVAQAYAASNRSLRCPESHS